MADYWFSSRRMTIWVKIESKMVIDAAPIARKFVGQPSKNLADWMKRQGGFKWEALKDHE